MFTAWLVETLQISHNGLEEQIVNLGLKLNICFSTVKSSYLISVIFLIKKLFGHSLKIFFTQTSFGNSVAECFCQRLGRLEMEILRLINKTS